MFLPLFPLEIVVFPGEQLPLHIFEPRYKQLIGECRDEGITFGIPPAIGEEPAEYGTEMELLRILKEYDSGEMDIVTRGIRVFRLISFQAEVPDKLYSGGDVEPKDDDLAADGSLREQVIDQFNALQRLLRSNKQVDAEVENLSYVIGHHVGLGVAQKVKLLALRREDDRLKFLLDHLRRAIPEVEKSEKTRKKVGGNGHMKDFPKTE